jgi:hypothetical protein
VFQEGELIFDGDSGRSLLDAARDFSGLVAPTDG